MDTLFICRKCQKPDSGKVEGKPRCGKALYKKLAARDDLPFRIRPCKCLGQCKKGPNGLAMPGNIRLNHLSVKTVKKLRDKHPALHHKA